MMIILKKIIHVDDDRINQTKIISSLEFHDLFELT